MPTEPTIQLQAFNLSCIRDDRVLFEDLSFDLSAGQVLLLEGKNGSGKTSLLRILCGFREADTGQIKWRGDDLDDSEYYVDMAYVGHLDGVKKRINCFRKFKSLLGFRSSGAIFNSTSTC